MNCRSIEEPIFLTVLNFIPHHQFSKETAALQRRFPKLEEGLESFKKICEVHFHPTEPNQVLAPGKLHRIKQLELYTIWKIELAVKGLRSDQFPRVWFAVKGSNLAFLCLQTHIDNYDTNEIDRLVERLVTDIF